MVVADCWADAVLLIWLMRQGSCQKKIELVLGHGLVDKLIGEVDDDFVWEVEGGKRKKEQRRPDAVTHTYWDDDEAYAYAYLFLFLFLILISFLYYSYTFLSLYLHSFSIYSILKEAQSSFANQTPCPRYQSRSLCAGCF